ncbi:MAG TPA: AI-2E family transporter [Stellaceae bacterium]|jgi:predicted PurR-regulated permease PerM|nr:AI-2E family transporter [Stellaceae bacterium]
METDRRPAFAPISSTFQRFARVALAAVVVAVGLWILGDFLPALAWAGVLAIALWPLYAQLLAALPAHSEKLIGPLIGTLLIGVVFIAPLVLLGIAVARESHFVIEFIVEARHHGIAAPEWLDEVPLVGTTLHGWWQSNLSDPAVAEELIGRVNFRTLTVSAREYGGEVVHRLAIFLFTLLTLFFLFRDGAGLAARVRNLSDRMIGVRGEMIARQMIAAVHGTVNGLVLVGLAEGIILGVVYLVAGLPYWATAGAITGVAAVIPFAAPVVYLFAGLYLFAIGKTVGAAIVVVTGSVIVFAADHFVRPVLIGGAIRLPFLLVLLGILGGLESMGFIGLFLGPAVMAAMVSLWREWTEPMTPETVAEAAATEPTGSQHL